MTLSYCHDNSPPPPKFGGTTRLDTCFKAGKRFVQFFTFPDLSALFHHERLMPYFYIKSETLLPQCNVANWVLGRSDRLLLSTSLFMKYYLESDIFHLPMDFKLCCMAHSLVNTQLHHHGMTVPHGCGL